ncbi:MAG: ABC transporter ATP-binding protein [Oscillospiraceae bacterium]|nr:ABC transporter ATP-binding protein [Oscillospiraceae bacterium]
MAEKIQTENKGPHGPGGGPRGGFQKPKNLGKTLTRLFGYLASRKLMLICALLCVLISSVGMVLGTYLLRPIINNLENAVLSGQPDLPGLFQGIAAMFLTYTVAAAASYGQASLMAIIAQKGCNALRRDLFDKLQTLPLSYFDRNPHGQLMSRFTNDADNVQLALEQSVVMLLSSGISFVGTVAVMLWLSPLLFLLTAVILAVILMVFRVLGGKSRRYYKEQQAALGAVNGNIQEMIEGLKVVKAFTHETQAKEEFARLNEAYRVASSKAGFYSSAIMPISANITNIGFALTATLGGVLAIVQGFDVGGFVIYLNYNRQVAQPINQFSMQMTTILSALAGAERIFEVMDAEPELDEGKVTLVPVEAGPDGVIQEYTGGEHRETWAWKCPQSPVSRLEQGSDGAWSWRLTQAGGTEEVRPVRGPVYGTGSGAYVLVELKGDVRLNHVDFSYVPDKPVLKDVSVYAKPGQKIAFVGSTGAGKTTITNLINRFYEIQGGTITYDGIDVKNISKDSLRRSLGAVLQDTHLFTGTVMENIRYGRLEATDEECIEAAKSANAHSFIRRLPDGYNTMITGDGANLSQGQRQLLAIARAAVADPPVMILDEATSSIDTRTEQLISKGMDALMEDRTVFVIAHRLSTVRNSNAIAVIEAGKIIEKGSHQELLDQQGRYYKLYTGQFQLS